MLRKYFLLKLINFWPPYLGAGVKVKKIAPDFSHVEVEMKLRFWNKNYVGTHFGGSLYSMTDPFLMLMLIERLGKNYIVWDKSASIRFKKPGKGKVKALFQLSEDDVKAIKQKADENDKYEPEFVIQIKNEQNDVIAEVTKLLYVKKNPPHTNKVL